MSTATLVINGDTSGLVAAFSDAAKAAAAAEKAIVKGAEDAAKKASDSYRKSQRAFVSAQRSMVVEAQRAVAAEVKAEQQRMRAARMSADARKKAETEATRVAREEAQKRGLSAEQEARVKQNALEKYTRLYETEERKQTVAAEREAAKRRQAFQKARSEEQRDIRQERRSASQTGRSVVGVAGEAASAAAGFAGTAIGMIRDARAARAGADRQLGYAARAAGASAPETQRRAREFALQHNMTYDEVATSLAEGQEHGSVLEATNGQTSAQALDAALRTIRMANAEGVNGGQLLSARGRLGQAGLQGAALEEGMRSLIGAAQQGSVEVEQIITEGLPGASRLMQQRVAGLGASATPEQRQAVALNAFKESIALQEVAASTGRRAGTSANALAAVNNALSTPRRQEQILTNINTAAAQANVNDPAGRARRDALVRFREEMFERDTTRGGDAMRLRGNVSPLDFAARLTQVTGGNASAASNILAGSGHGNPQSFQANWRDLVSFLGGQTATGQTGTQRVREMMGATVSDEKIDRDAAEVESDEQSRINRLEETRLGALTSNTAGLQNLTNRIDSFNARNPLAAPAAVGAGAVLTKVLGATGAKALPFVGAAMSLLGVASDVQAGTSGVRTAGNFIGDVASGGAIVNSGVQDASNLITGEGGMAAAARRHAAGGAQPAAPSATTDVLGMLSRALTDLNSTLRGGITATATPTDAAQAASNAPIPTPPAR